MTPTTPTTALADLDNTAKEALRDLSHIENHLQESSAPTTVMNRALDVRMGIKELRAALARRAAQPNSPEFGGIAAQPVAPVQMADEHRAVIEEAAQVLESAAAHNRAKGRTVLERTQQDRADRLRLILAAQPAEGAGQAELDAELRREVAMMYQLLDDGEWAEHIAKTPHGQCLETAITKLVAKAGGAGQAGQVAVHQMRQIAGGGWVETDADEETSLKRMPHWKGVFEFRTLYTAPTERAAAPAEQLDPVAGDLLPPVGSKVLIHLARRDAWVEHTVSGYYVWGALSHQVREGEKNAHRVFVRVKDSQGYDNARLLSEVRATHQPSAQVKP